MDDYASLSSVTRPWPLISNQQTTTAGTNTSSGLSTGNFQQLLTTLMLGIALQGMTSSSLSDTSDSSLSDSLGGSLSSSLGSSVSSSLSSSLGSSSTSLLSGLGQTTDTSSFMAPLMLQLLEKLLANELQADQTAQTAPTPTVIKPTTTSIEESNEPQNKPSGAPVKGNIITQGSHSGHVALDFGVSVGTPVKSTLDGKVVYAGWNNEGYGNLVIVENGPYRVYFAHLSKIPVNVGDEVTADMVIGYSGNTGNSTGPHLHYEVRQNGAAIDPTSFTLSSK